MAVHQLKDGRWVIEYRLDGRKKREYFGRGLQAEAAARTRFEQIGVRDYGQSRVGGPSFSEVCRAYLDDRMTSLAPSTIDGLLPKIKAVYLPALGSLGAGQVTEARIQAYIQQRLERVKKTTIHRELSDIRAILNWAVRKRIIMSNPMLGATWPKRDDERIRPPSSDEVRALLSHSQPHLFRALVIAWYCGLRVGEELFSRKWHDVDWDSQTLYIVSAQKGGLDTRRVPIASEVLPRLLQWYIEDGENGDRYILRWHDKRVRTLKTAWKRAKQRAGITRRLRPYDIRHAFVTDLLDAGADPHTVGDMAGHKDKATTLYVYHHLSGERSRQAVEKRKSILDGQGKKG